MSEEVPKGQYTLTFKNGSVIVFKATEAPEKFQGMSQEAIDRLIQGEYERWEEKEAEHNE